MSRKVRSICYSLVLLIYNRIEQAIPKPYRVWLSQRLSSYGINVLNIRTILVNKARTDFKISDGDIRRSYESSIGEYLLKIIRNGERSNKNNGISRQADQQIDVVVPVYNAYEATKKCLESVLKNTDINSRLIVIDDCSTDERVSMFLEEFSSRDITGNNLREIVYLRNEYNMGFVKTVNRGFKESNNHTVILNSDTEVPPGWLSRLIRPINENADRVASVTPFSNSATICSFPEFCKDNEIGYGLTVEEYDSYFSKYGTEVVLEIPTGVGFCMAINRKALLKVGYFDDVVFGRGYAEENDWCMRAHKSGFVNVMVQNLFIYHKHGMSFQSLDKKQLLETNLSLLEQRHPEYNKKVQDFISIDPGRYIRDTILTIMDAKTRISCHNNYLVITHSIGGGSDFFKDDLIQILEEENTKVIILSYDRIYSCWNLRYRGYAKPVTFRFKEDIFEADRFKNLCRLFVVNKIIVNSLVSFPDTANCLKSIKLAEVPYVYLLHDYFPMCVSWALFDFANHKSCNGKNEISVCKECLHTNRLSEFAEFKHYKELDIKKWRTDWREFLMSASGILLFSEESHRLLLKYYPELGNTRLVEHYLPVPRTRSRNRDGRISSPLINIGVIGAIGPHKGAKIVYDMVKLIRKDKLPITITVIGFLPDKRIPFVSQDGILNITGPYNKKDLCNLLEGHKIDLVFIPSVWPETYCFTVSEALLLGYPVMVFDIGAQAERVKHTVAGVIVKEISAEAAISEVLKLLQDPHRLDELSGNTRNYLPIGRDIYKKHLSAGLRL